MAAPYDLSRAFERIENYLIDSMMRNFKHHRAEEMKEGYNWEQWQVKQLQALEEYRKMNKAKFSTEFADLNNRVGDMLTATAADASYKQEQRILKAIQRGYPSHRIPAQSQAAFFRVNERKMNALIEATTNDLKRAEQAVLRRSNDVYRRAIFDAQVFMNSGAATYEQAVDMAVKDMLSAGLQCVEYKNGARHTLPDYAEMAIRTANKRAYLRGQGEKMQEWGMSTVIINRRHGACGRCADFVGMVFIDDVYAGGKKSDADGKYPLLSDAMKAGLFHPRCKDSSSPYFEGISTPPDREVLPKKAQEDLTEIERAEQKAAYGRRMEKMNRRLSKYALDPDNKKMYRGRAEQWARYTEKWQSYHEKQLAKSEKAGIIVNESSPRKMKDISCAVDWNIIQSDAYSERFTALSNDKKVSSAIETRAKWALNNRDGADTEEIYAISLFDGHEVGRITNQHIKSAVRRTEKFTRELDAADSSGEKVLLLHNHPKGLPPSISDINALYRNKNVAGITVGHNGSIYYYTRPVKVILESDWNSALRKYKRYSEITSMEKALEDLCQEYGFIFRIL
ncbi:MAG: minor capsid protein [Ruminococcus sp.]|nr:minor capsid protein [Ruminococcus sp.]